MKGVAALTINDLLISDEVAPITKTAKILALPTGIDSGKTVTFDIGFSQTGRFKGEI